MDTDLCQGLFQFILFYFTENIFLVDPFIRRIPRQAGQQNLDPDAADPANQIAIHQSINPSPTRADRLTDQEVNHLCIFDEDEIKYIWNYGKIDKQADAGSDNKNGNSNNDYRW